jgi:predicted P-loop ATPase
VSIPGKSAWRALEDTDYARMKMAMERIGVHANREALRDAVALVAEENQVDTAQVWLDSLEWDGVERVSTFGHQVLKAMDCPYTTAVSEYMWTALAGRIIHPGCQAEMVPIFIGAQGNRKTSTIKAMVPGPEFYVEIDLQHRDDNLARMLRGKLVGELAEMKGLATKGNEAIKAWVTRTHEEWVPKYKERQVTYPRRTAFIGTSNPPRFLDDPTGERRWLPLR